VEVYLEWNAPKPRNHGLPADLERGAAGIVSAGSGNSDGSGPRSSLPCEPSGKWPAFLLRSRPSSAGAGAACAGEFSHPCLARIGLDHADANGASSWACHRYSRTKSAFAVLCLAPLATHSRRSCERKHTYACVRPTVGGLFANVVTVGCFVANCSCSIGLVRSRSPVLTNRTTDAKRASGHRPWPPNLPHAADGSSCAGHEPVGRHHT